MPLQDSNPERRNLTVLSLCIILFYIARGMFSDGSVRLQIVNVVFLKPEVLAYSAWFLLGWFCFRYWQVHQNDWKTNFCAELHSTEEDCRFFFRKNLEKIIKQWNPVGTIGFENLKRVTLTTSGTDKARFACTFQIKDKQDVKHNFIISSYSERFAFFRYAIFMSIRCQTVPGYFVPYLLFYTAVFLGFYYLLLPTP